MFVASWSEGSSAAEAGVLSATGLLPDAEEFCGGAVTIMNANPCYANATIMILTNAPRSPVVVQLQ